jgi:hypothetical protein
MTLTECTARLLREWRPNGGFHGVELPRHGFTNTGI